MKEVNLAQLFDKFEAGQCSPAEQRALQAWLHSYRTAGKAALTDQDFSEARMNMLEAIDRATSPAPQKSGVFTLWPRVAAAAVALLILGASLFYVNSLSINGNQQEGGRYSEEAAPGTVGATLTLADGRKVRLSDSINGDLATEAGVTIRKTSDGELIYEINSDPSKVGMTKGKSTTNTLSTAPGETYQVQLPDGSRVWLNSASSLSYPVHLMKNGKRQVSLQGEGFFAVSKDKKHPFIVQAGNQLVEVLGTQFNINSYTDEAMIKTTLIEGAVKVTLGDEQKLISPGEQVVNDGKKLAVGKADAESVTDWKQGDFNLDRIDLKLALRKIARWYNIQVVYDADLPEGLTSGGWFSRSQKLSTILKAIEKSGQVRFTLKDKTLYVKQNKR